MLLKDGARSNPAIVSAFLKVIHDILKHSGGPLWKVASLMSDILRISTENCIEYVRSSPAEGVEGRIDPVASPIPFLISMLEQFRESTFDDTHFSDVSL